MTDSSHIKAVHACQRCAAVLPFAPKPILQFGSNARLLIIGQAPGLQAHQRGVPWQDDSGDRLRTWLGITAEQFYGDRVAIVPMGFCYPGKGKSGDLPPRPECAPEWHPRLLGELKNVQLTLLIGQYAQRAFLKDQQFIGLTDSVREYQRFLPEYFPLPHPSPRNNGWLTKHPWFRDMVLPALKERTKAALEAS